MPDRVSPAERSRIMSRIKSRDTKPEKVVRSLLHRLGYRFRLHRKDLPGNPDIVLPRHRVALFVHGCFWHGHPECRRATLPQSNAEFWASKISRNAERDAAAHQSLRALGWLPVVVWQCELRDLESLTVRLTSLLSGETAQEFGATPEESGRDHSKESAVSTNS